MLGDWSSGMILA